MIIDKVENFGRYVNLHPDFRKISLILASEDLASKPAGRLTYEGENFYINIDEVDLRPYETAYPEVHDEYIDIQLPLTRAEEMGWMPRSECKSVREVREGKDIAFYNELPANKFRVEPGQFVIFFPEDAHSPIIGEGRTKKAIVKVHI
ncbi:MAG: YhcH/YjgK/YiaL family protein [Paludibacteraceae bacterium]|nr:YhcH/YjgK/YiaL family protein [Paludibacteraceae bacterium]MBR6041157.1 YhcH/YjgK/YiaL family protein [Paludibacteraceae bacterium]MCR5569948.1 YhcH/YjgK/YiaL family protein [Paludibacteraceae bacterium]